MSWHFHGMCVTFSLVHKKLNLASPLAMESAGDAVAPVLVMWRSLAPLVLGEAVLLGVVATEGSFQL